MNKKLAFSLVELMTFIAIVGIISAIAMQTFRNYDKGIRYLYSNTYHVLDRAANNVVNFSDASDPFERIDVSPEEGARRLCSALADIMNAIDRRCRAPWASDMGIGDLQPHFYGTNGVRFYVSRRLPSQEFIQQGENPTYFYLVYADLNGEKAPNSMAYVPGSANNGFRTTDPDIFAFAVLDSGRVCPLGPPEVDQRYMLSRVTYQVAVDGGDGENGSEVIIRYSNPSKPYYISKAEAWGYYLPGTDVNDNAIIDGNPYSYNGYIRSHISNRSPIYTFLNGAAFPRVPAIGGANSIRLRDASPQNGGYGCRRLSDIECDVIVDKYIY